MEDQDFNSIMWYYDIEDYFSVIDICNRIIKNDNYDYLAYGCRGQAYYRLEDNKKALKDYSKSIELNPKYWMGYKNRIKCLMNLDKFNLALIDIAILENNSDEKFNFEKGVCDFYVGNYEAAIPSLDIAIDECEYEYQYEFLLYLRAEAYFKIGLKIEYFSDIESIIQIENDESNSIEYLENLNEIDYSHVEKIKYKHPIDLISAMSFSMFDGLKKSIFTCVYIIEFENSEYYIGQTTNFQKRKTEHTNKFSDIKHFYINEVDKAKLLEMENLLISLFEYNAFRIRNRKQLDFTSHFDFEKQNKWKSEKFYNFISGTKFNNDEIRKEFADRFALLANMPYYEKLLKSMSLYVLNFIPNYLATEFNYWNITCLPRHLLKEQCLSRININAVPVISVYFDGVDLKYMIFCSKLPFIKSIQNGCTLFESFDKIESLHIQIRNGFENSEGDEITIHLNHNDFKYLIENEILYESIRLFNIRMMNKGGAGVDWKRKASHCLDFADDIHQEIIKTQEK